MFDISIKTQSVRRRLPFVLSALVLTGLTGCSLLTGSKKAPLAPKIAPPETLYNNGIDALRTRRYELAAAEFETLQQNYPYSGYIPNAQLMEGYSYYLKGKYPEAVQQLNRFISLHPTSTDSAYAYYLRSLCFYEQIADVQRDQQGTAEAMDALEEVVTRFPQSKYARDAQLKIDLCRDHLAGKEMLVGRYYQRERNYEGAINRYQRVVQDFQTTNHVPEALERMVEVYLDLGLTDQARKSAIVLGYNYPSSQWYHYAYNKLKSYKLLDNKLPLPGTAVTTPAKQDVVKSQASDTRDERMAAPAAMQPAATAPQPPPAPSVPATPAATAPQPPPAPSVPATPAAPAAPATKK